MTMIHSPTTESWPAARPFQKWQIDQRLFYPTHGNDTSSRLVLAKIFITLKCLFKYNFRKQNKV